MAKKPIALKPFIISSLRRASYRWPARNECLKANRIDRGLYRCNSCNKTFNRKEIRLDHIKPVIPVETGFTTWDTYIERMFCEPSGYQTLCNICHSSKSLIEKNQRVLFRKLNKNKDNIKNKLNQNKKNSKIKG